MSFYETLLRAWAHRLANEAISLIGIHGDTDTTFPRKIAEMLIVNAVGVGIPFAKLSAEELHKILDEEIASFRQEARAMNIDPEKPS